jgi:hypothetical protein
VALPGERLARVPGSLTEADLAAAEVFTIDDLEAADGKVIEPTSGGRPVSGDGEADGEDGQRRRRRRGGRGRGRGRGQGDGTEDGPFEADVRPTVTAGTNTVEDRDRDRDRDRDEDEDEVAVAPRSPKAKPFGSVWDSQLGTPVAASGAGRAPDLDEEDFDEPEIPEYLIAEQRRGTGRPAGGGAGRGPRGGRSAYQSAMERERYGGGGGRSGGINRYPDVSARTTPARDQAQRDAGGGYGRRDQIPASPRGSGEWSELPPELEAQLRAQLAQAPSKVPATAKATAPEAAHADEAQATAGAKPKRASTRVPATAKATAPETAHADEAQATAGAKPKRASARKPATADPA